MERSLQNRSKTFASSFASKAEYQDSKRLALGELEALAGALLSVLLALFHARIARQKTVGAQRGTQFRVVARNGARQAHTHSSSLSANAAAMHGAHHVHL